jgi:hypothetical protein
MKHVVKKHTDTAFGNRYYLLGVNEDRCPVWLQEPSWDCGWYWGCGYVNTFQHGRLPSLAKDIDSHRHADGYLFGQIRQGPSNHENYVHSVYESPNLVKTTFTAKQGWELGELFAQMYLLKDMAAFCSRSRPGCNVSGSNPVEHGDCTDMAKRINQVMLPAVFKAIEKILTEEKE